MYVNGKDACCEFGAIVRPLKTKRGFIVKNFIKSLIVLGAVFAVSAPAFAGAQEDHKQLTTILCNAAKDTKRGLKDDERKSLMSSCLESKKTGALMAHYPAAKTIWVKIKYVSAPPGAVLYIATPENRMWQSERTWEMESAKASIAEANKSMTDPRWKSEKDKKERLGLVITFEQKRLTSLNPQLKELEDSAAATGVREGYAPFTVRYPLDVDTGVKSDEKQVFILPATLRWASGATAPATIRIDLNRIELLKAAGTQKTITVTRPDNVPGRVADEEFALKVEASNQKNLARHAGCKMESAAIEKERAANIAYIQALPGWPRNVSEADLNAANEMLRKFQEREINFEFGCVSPAAASLMEQRFHDLNVETQMKIDAINARQQSTITIQPSRPSMEELIMQQSTQPPVSNSIHCSTNNVNGTVYTDCN